jgi:small subunit ribosomal protein S10
LTLVPGWIRLSFPEIREFNGFVTHEGEQRVSGINIAGIKIRMEAYDHEVLDRTAQEIVETARQTGADVHGPIPLPTRIERYTVLRSPHIDRKSREQFEIRTHKRLIYIYQPDNKTIDALNKGISLPPGVDLEIKPIKR